MRCGTDIDASNCMVEGALNSFSIGAEEFELNFVGTRGQAVDVIRNPTFEQVGMAIDRDPSAVAVWAQTVDAGYIKVEEDFAVGSGGAFGATKGDQWCRWIEARIVT